jgi:hypothetical protein
LPNCVCAWREGTGVPVEPPRVSERTRHGSGSLADCAVAKAQVRAAFFLRISRDRAGPVTGPVVAVAAAGVVGGVGSAVAVLASPLPLLVCAATGRGGIFDGAPAA